MTNGISEIFSPNWLLWKPGIVIADYKTSKFPIGNRDRAEYVAQRWKRVDSTRRLIKKSPLSSAEDGFKGHPITEKTVVIGPPPPELRYHWNEALSVMVRRMRLRMINNGVTQDGQIAVTFRTYDDMIQFKLAWTGWEKLENWHA